ncbi:MAG: hypothetical protein K2P84_07015 [Undibacterium sp.]|nr:hypothetical protein [Undibacterium sp.]
MIKLNRKVAMLAVAASAILAACGGFVYTTVGGSVKGLGTGSSINISNNSGPYITLAADGAFSFPTASNATYDITILKQPNLVNCTIQNGKGKMSSESSLNNVLISCLPNVPVVVTVTNATADSSVALKLTDTDATATAEIKDSKLTLTLYAIDAKPYVVAVSFPPLGRVCTLQNASGTAAIGNPAASANVVLNCVDGVPVAGTLAGLKVNTFVELTNNDQDLLTLRADGTFNFAFSLLNDASYNVQVKTQPLNQKCTVTNGTGKVALTTPVTVTNISVTCIGL